MYEINIQTTIIWFWSTVGGTRCWAPKQIGNFFAWSFYATAFGINNVDEEIFFVFSFYPLLFSILLYNNGKKCVFQRITTRNLYITFFFFFNKALCWYFNITLSHTLRSIQIVCTCSQSNASIFFSLHCCCSYSPCTTRKFVYSSISFAF